MQNSEEFFQAETDAAELDQVLDASCSVVGANCNSLMQSYATQLKDSANCGDDFNKQEPSVLRAYQGFLAYLPVYQAGCLKLDPNNTSSSKQSSGNNEYCFTSSVNATNQADISLYYVPLGITLPGDSRPTCSSCTQQTMSYFAAAAQNLSTPLGQDYGSAAVQVNQGCGPSFVNATVQPIAGTGGTSGASTISLGALNWSIIALTGLSILLS
ncbi:hypothetical protein MMC10_007780 [Thelotrema lepadinum]|nr:hypothetical protein [Thelotrema lepadinum]